MYGDALIRKEIYKCLLRPTRHAPVIYISKIMCKRIYRLLIPTLTFFYLWLALGGLDQAAKLWLKLVIIAIGAFLSLLWIRMVRLPPFREVRADGESR